MSPCNKAGRYEYCTLSSTSSSASVGRPVSSGRSLFSARVHASRASATFPSDASKSTADGPTTALAATYLAGW